MNISKLTKTLLCATALPLALTACDTSEFLSALENIQPEPTEITSQVSIEAGDDVCFKGGVLTLTGLDLNADEQLSGDEIETSVATCDAPALNTTNNFARIATFPICQQFDANCDDDTETVAEIVDVSKDGMTLIYTDSPGDQIGFVDITTPSAPVADGLLAVGGEPTSVAVKDDFALIGVNTSTDFVNVSGNLAVVNVATKTVTRTIDLGGQPDSVAVSPDGNYAVIAIENERDEDLGEGRVGQLPAGFVVVVDTSDTDPANWTTSNVDVTGLADIVAADPEPEYVDINEDNIAVISLQENNHLVLIDLATAQVVGDFSAGTLDLDGVDTAEEDLIDQTSSLTGIPREPDGLTWIGNSFIATADEGDMDGGSRSFTIFDTDGNVVFTSAEFADQLAASIGHYPEGRSENKGVELENAEAAEFGADRYLFVNSERGSFVMVYDVADPTNPVYKQVLPAALGPEGVKAIPSRNLLVAASEEDNRGDKFRGALNIYSYAQQDATYPAMVSVDRADGSPIPWAAQSGLAADLTDANVLYAIEDSAYIKSRMFSMDISTTPVTLTGETRITDANDVFANAFVLPTAELADSFDATDLAALINDDKTVNIDPEGISAAAAGGFWIASEGAGTKSDTANRPIESLNFIFKVNADGVIEEVVTLPDAVNDIQVRFGFEGVAEYDGKLYVAIQRAWEGEANPRIGIYDITAKTWEFVFYPLDAAESQNGGWVGLSDISSKGDGTFLVLERDNQGGPDAAIKRIYEIDLTTVTDGATITKTLVRDLVSEGDLTATNGYINEKIEGLAVTSTGDVWISSDNDGVDDHSGETTLMSLGAIAQ